jgi:6-phosphofructokinase 2
MKIVTLTLNPALDKSTHIERLLSEKKLRCEEPVYEPGGGGINVSRALKIMGSESMAIYVAGGPAGEKLQELLEKEGIEQKVIPTQEHTRENFMVMEDSTGNHFRFGMPGSRVSEKEVQACLQAVRELPDEVEFLVASGSLPPGAPDDFYGQVAGLAKEKNIKCIVDTSGKALEKAAETGVYLFKPNLGELSKLAGKDEISAFEQEEIAQKIIKEGKAEILIVSLGARGALMVTKDSIEYVVPPTIKQQSTVGAGDSMVAGVVLSLSRGDELSEVLKWGVAAGTAATITAGTELCRKDDVEKIYRWLNQKEHASG